MAKDEEVLTIDELAAKWKVAKGNVYRLTMQKGPDAIPMRKIGRNIRFIPSEVDQWARKRANR